MRFYSRVVCSKSFKQNKLQIYILHILTFLSFENSICLRQQVCMNIEYLVKFTHCVLQCVWSVCACWPQPRLETFCYVAAGERKFRGILSNQTGGEKSTIQEQTRGVMGMSDQWGEFSQVVMATLKYSQLQMWCKQHEAAGTSARISWMTVADIWTHE